MYLIPSNNLEMIHFLDYSAFTTTTYVPLAPIGPAIFEAPRRPTWKVVPQNLFPSHSHAHVSTNSLLNLFARSIALKTNSVTAYASAPRLAGAVTMAIPPRVMCAVSIRGGGVLMNGHVLPPLV